MHGAISVRIEILALPERISVSLLFVFLFLFCSLHFHLEKKSEKPNKQNVLSQLELSMGAVADALDSNVLCLATDKVETLSR